MASTPAATAFSLVREDLSAVEKTLVRAVETEEPLMRRLLGLVLPGGGKRLRPVLALLCGRIDTHRPNVLVPFAAALEMLHTATLVHDDIVDESGVRRGEPTLNVRTSNLVAVLVGDFMFAQAAAHATSTGDLRVIDAFTSASMAIIGGQIDEAWADGGLGLTTDQYYRRIGSKTAVLFALAARGGAMLSNASSEVVEAVGSYGYQLGLAFQVVDDILDVVGDERSLGKPVGSDIRQGTVTLPAILVRDRLPQDLFRAAYMGDGQREEAMQTLLQTIRADGGVEGSYAEAERLVKEAVAALEILPSGEVKDALKEMASFVVRRAV